MGVDPLCGGDAAVEGGATAIRALQTLLISYITVQCAIRMMAPQSIRKVYIPGIAVNLARRDQDTKAWEDVAKSQPVTRVMRGFQRFYDKHNPAASRMKVAFGMDLAVRSKKVMRLGNLAVKSGMSADEKELIWTRMYTVMTVGIWFMLRRSEHIVAPGLKGKSRLLRRLVVFFDKNGDRIPYEEVGHTKAAKVILNIEFAKTDQSGFGRRTSHVRQEGKENVCVVCVLEDWIAMTRDVFGATDDLPLYDVPGFPSVNLNELHKVMEATVQSLGVEGYGAKATSHSLRYGGATMMAGAGFPQYLIAHYGGWAEDSESLKRYARPSDASIALVSEFMAKAAKGNLSLHHIQDLVVRQQAMQGKGLKKRRR
jgi:hypothetical protein